MTVPLRLERGGGGVNVLPLRKRKKLELFKLFFPLGIQTKLLDQISLVENRFPQLLFSPLKLVEFMYHLYIMNFIISPPVILSKRLIASLEIMKISQ